jgi:NADPH oxidase
VLEQKKLRRVDFIWVNRDYQSFEWFIELLGQLELQQINSMAERFIGIHLYMTSAKVVQEIKPLENAEFDKKGQIESKLDDFALRLNPGRPDFDRLFEDISATKKGKEVDVFFCGNRQFGRVVQNKCFEHKYKFFKEYF